MSSVTPTSDQSSYYLKQFTKMEEDHKKDLQNAEQRAETRIDELEKNYKNTIKKQSEDHEQNLRDVTENANASLAKEKASAREEIEKHRAQMYDRYGRFNGAEVDQLKMREEQYSRDFANLEKKHRQDINEQEKAHEKRIDDLKHLYDGRTEEVIVKARDAANTSYHRAFEDQNFEYDTYKKDAENKNQILNRELFQNMKAHVDHASQALAENEKSLQHRLEQQDRAHLAHNEKQQIAMGKQMVKGARQQQESHDEETRVLRDQVREVTRSNVDAMKQRAQATQDVIRETEDDQRKLVRHLNDEFETSLERLKTQNHNANMSLAEKNEQAMRQKDQYFTDLVGKLNRENHRAQADIQRAYTEERRQADLQAKQNAEHTEKRINNQAHELTQQKEIALQSQGRAFNEAMKREHQAGQDKINALLDQDQNGQKVSGDDPLRSPASLEVAFQRSVLEGQGKALEVENTRNKKQMESLQKKYEGQINEVLQEQQTKQRGLMKQGLAEQQIERSQFVAHMQDTQLVHETEMRAKEREYEKTIDSMQKTYADTLNLQRRNYEELLTEVKADAELKVAKVRQEADFAARMAQRNFAARQNDIIREYAKKMEDQKVEFDRILEDSKALTSNQIRDMEKKHRQTIDEQQRTYEQRLATQESQAKERERYMQQNFDDTIDKLKRSNAMLINKKS